MRSTRRPVFVSLAAAFASLALVLGVALPASATSQIVTGELNCTGSTVYYNTTRYTSGSATIQYSLSNSAGSTYGTWGTYLGVYIVAENSYKGLKFMFLPQSPNAVLSSTYWLAGTAFKMYGKMPVSDGACDNVFGGTLYF
jgi:hypothetical protein